MRWWTLSGIPGWCLDASSGLNSGGAKNSTCRKFVTARWNFFPMQSNMKPFLRYHVGASSNRHLHLAMVARWKSATEATNQWDGGEMRLATDILLIGKTGNSKWRVINWETSVTGTNFPKESWQYSPLLCKALRRRSACCSKSYRGKYQWESNLGALVPLKIFSMLVSAICKFYSLHKAT